MKHKKNCVYIVEILGCEEDDMNKRSSLGKTQIFFFLFTLLLGKRWHNMQIYPKRKKRKKKRERNVGKKMQVLVASPKIKHKSFQHQR